MNDDTSNRWTERPASSVDAPPLLMDAGPEPATSVASTPPATPVDASNSNDDDGARTRWAVYRIFIIVSCAFMVARIMVVENDRGTTPFLSANDRSRWCTIRSLGDEQTYIIDNVITTDDGERFDPDWNTIDKVVHRGIDESEHYYSSKPTLLTTLLAGEYVFAQWLTGWTLAEDALSMGRLMLIVTNVIPMAIFFVLVGLVVERFAKRTWTRMFIMGSATFGTFLTSYSITLNNHLPAAVSVMACLYCILAIWSENRNHWGYFLAAGLSGAFAAANELPALSFLLAAFCIVTVKNPKQSMVGFVPGMALVAAGFFGTNFMAHQSWRPPYTHRADGPRIAVLEFDLADQLDAGEVPDEIRQAVDQNLRKLTFTLSAQSQARPALLMGPNNERRWEIWDPEDMDRVAVVEVIPGTAYEIREWDNWYEYETSYWIPGRKGPIDRGEENQAAYIFHISVGHHGFFSLTPIWFIGLAGLLLACVQPESRLRVFALMSIALFVICFAFYASRPIGDRNYGGVTSGLRWLFWFAPMFLVGMIPICDRLSKYVWFQLLAELCLALSIFSWAFSPLNPWTHPWLYQWFVPPPT